MLLKSYLSACVHGLVVFLCLAIQQHLWSCPIPAIDHRMYSFSERGWCCDEDIWIRKAERKARRKLTEHERKKIVTACNRCKKQNVALEKAVSAGEIEALQALLASGVSPNRLVRSRAHKHPELARYYSDRSADPLRLRRIFPLKQDGESYLAYVSLLELAMAHNDQESVVVLLKAGAHVNTVVCMGETALGYALSYSSHCVPLLLERGARMPTLCCELFELFEQERLLFFSHVHRAQERQMIIETCLLEQGVPDVLIGLIFELEGSVIRQCPIPSHRIDRNLILCGKKVEAIRDTVQRWYGCQTGGKIRTLSPRECKALEELLQRAYRYG